MIEFACIAPHPPIILPSVGSPDDKKKVNKTIKALEKLGTELKEKNLDTIIISSPHPDWGFNVPLFFLAQDFKGEIKPYLTGAETPKVYFEKGKLLYQKLDKNKKYGIIASGDMSHVLKEEGPYGFHPDGPKFDKEFIRALQEKEIEKILKLEEIYPESANCGLRSFCFLLGILEASSKKWTAEILSYQAPFGVGYLVAEFILK